MNRAEKRRNKKLANKSVKGRKPSQASSPIPTKQEQLLATRQAISLAVQHHQAGELAKAEGIYQQILQVDPKQPTALHLLGVVAHQVGKNDIAVDLITQALAINPDFAEAHFNLGNARSELNQIEEALASYKKALDNKPDYAEAQNGLGNVFQKQGNLDDALASYREALSIKPDYAGAHFNLGNLLQKQGYFEEAIHSYASSNSKESQAKSLECLYSLARYTDFYLKLDKLIKADATNIHPVAISAFASQQLDRADPHPFCKKPMEFIHVYASLKDINDIASFLRGLFDELENRSTVWNPYGKATRDGYQSPPDLFINPMSFLAKLDKIIWASIETYRSELSSQDCAFIKMFPKEAYLSGWFVRLKIGGHQTEHNHSNGWLSGVIYLKLPKVRNSEEGSIEFGLWGNNYPILDENYPKKQVYPKVGDLILFPSSLFHRTMPFYSDDERVSIAFDLVPALT